MQIFCGTSGYSYKEWKGSFYPEKIPASEMLGYYATKLNTVEINNTFYRMPKKENLEDWASQVPQGFRFILKASQKITHRKRLKDTAEEMEFLTANVLTLDEKLGALLFQLPPNLKKDTERLKAFLPLIPRAVPAAFEFRHESWLDEETFGLLRENNMALVIAETDDQPDADFIKTAPWTYLRLRRSAYSDAELHERVAKVKNQGWETAYIFFKHEDEGTGPALAKKFREMAGL